VTYYIQKIAENYIRNLTDEPEQMIVHESYLQGLSNDEFKGGFLALQRLVRSLYIDIKNNPLDFGVPAIEIDEGNPKSKLDFTKSNTGFMRVPNLLYALGLTGRLSDDMNLSVNNEALFAAAKALKITKVKDLIEKVKDYGFEILGTNELTISYPDCRALTAGLKSMAEARAKCRPQDVEYFCLVMPQLLEKETIKKISFGFDALHKSLNETNKPIAQTLHGFALTGAKANINSILCGVRSNSWSCVYTGKKSKRVLMTISTRQESLNIKLNLENMNSYMDEVMEMPEDFREKIRTNGWGCSKETCNPRCAGGFVFEMGNVVYSKCRGGAFFFGNISANDVNNLKTLLECEMRREA